MSDKFLDTKSTQGYAGDTKFEAINVAGQELIGLEIYLDGDGTDGVITLEQSNMRVADPSTIPDERWYPVPDSESDVITEPDGVLYNIKDMGARWIRVVYTGTGTGDAHIEGVLKGL